MSMTTAASPVSGQHKVFVHTQRVREALADPLTTPPITLDIDPTTNCNNNCPKCTFPDTASLYLDFSLFQRVVAEAKQMGVKAITFTGGGEPTLHPRFLDMLKEVKQQGLEAGLITNGSRFTPAFAEEALPLLSWVRFSFDAGSPETYFLTHGLLPHKYKLLTDNMAAASKIRREKGLTVGLSASYLIAEANAVDYERAVELVRNLGLDHLQFKPMQQPDTKTVGRYRYDTATLKEAEKILESILHRDYGEHFHVFLTRLCPSLLSGESLEYRQSPLCYGQRFTTSLGADGRLYGCCHYKYDPDFELGNLHFDSLADIWRSERRARFLAGLDPRKRCLKSCKLEGLNETFWEHFSGLGDEELSRRLEGLQQTEYPYANFI